ncbi:unnamed protein product [Sphagnum troendelagicum]
MDDGASSSRDMAIVLSDSEGEYYKGQRHRRYLASRYSQEVLDDAVAKLMIVFPDLRPEAAAEHLSSQLKRTSPKMALRRVTLQFLEHGIPSNSTQTWCRSGSPVTQKPISQPVPTAAAAAAAYVQKDTILGQAAGKRKPLRSGPVVSRPLSRSFLPSSSRPQKKRLRKDRKEQEEVKAKEEAGHEGSAIDLNQPEYEAPPQETECGCCCSDFPFDEMVQCAEGHLFCFNCLRRRVEEFTFGGLQTIGPLVCMDTEGCTESFPASEVRRALPAEILSKYEQRQAEDAVARAELPGLVYCPFCNTPWQVDPELRVLKCGACEKASCILCRDPDHLPLRCEEVEKKTETSHRRRVEELMTKALIRECTKCRTELVKSDGCNKVRCRCGQYMCYVCRKPIEGNYKHFCQHARNPGSACSQCKLCNLWEQEEEHVVVKAAKEAAMKEIAEKEPSLLTRSIGPALEPQGSKKRHKGRALHRPVLPPILPENLARFAQAMANPANLLDLLDM